ncbi:hypothetical protein [Streptomyces globosus]|uniref:hypothetical protein n=1 Tax=Streptomyces globosus TaxID=68209 RepID=UPI0038085611
MPTHDQDPDIAAARKAQTDYLTAVQAARSDWAASDLAKVQAIDAAYNAYVTALQGAWDRIQARRRALLEYLETLVPVGPADTSPADRAVLTTAFRAAYEQASTASRDGRIRMLQDAERFNDDAARRGALTAILKGSDWHAIRDWAQHHLTTSGYVEEVLGLRGALAGTSAETTARFAVRECSPVRPPAEVQDLPRLITMRDASQAEG